MSITCSCPQQVGQLGGRWAWACPTGHGASPGSGCFPGICLQDQEPSQIWLQKPCSNPHRLLWEQARGEILASSGPSTFSWKKIGCLGVCLLSLGSQRAPRP